MRRKVYQAGAARPRTPRPGGPGGPESCPPSCRAARESVWRAMKSPPWAGRAWDEVAGFVQQQEMALQPVLDVYEFITTLKNRVFSKPAVAQEA